MLISTADASEEEVSEDPLATAIIAALAEIDESETPPERTQPEDSSSQDLHEVLQQPQAQYVIFSAAS